MSSPAFNPPSRCARPSAIGCRLRRLAAAACVLGVVARLGAEGSPPLITDDPGTPGAGHWEINVGAGTEQRPGARLAALPLVDLNYGVGDRLQLNFEVPYLRRSEAGLPAVTGPGNSSAGVKWRFFDAGEEGGSVSVYPKVQFNNPGSSSVRRGLADAGTVWRLPFQFEKKAGPVTWIGQIGREIRTGGDAWFYGLSASHRFNRVFEAALELAGGAAAGLQRTSLALNCGLVVDLGEHHSLLLSLGRELHNHEEPRATLIYYTGIQWRL